MVGAAFRSRGGFRRAGGRKDGVLPSFTPAGGVNGSVSLTGIDAPPKIVERDAVEERRGFNDLTVGQA